VVVGDKLGICDQLEVRMQSLVSSYECEWKAVVNDPVRVKSFQQFVNTTETETGIEFMSERGQRRPVDWPAAAKRPGWKVRHVPIALEGNGLAGERIVEMEDERGNTSSRKWTLSWVEVGDVADWPQVDGGHAVKYGKSQLAIYNFTSRGEWYAAQNMSPDTRTFAMSRGMIGDKSGVPMVADPILKKIFALETGECLSDPGAFQLLTFRAKAECGKVFVELPPANKLDDILATDTLQVRAPQELEPQPSGCACGDKATEW
jgi:nitrite reductase (NADH) large subunit